MTTTHDPEPYYLWSHPRETARVCRPSEATFSAGEPEWVREYPVEAVAWQWRKRHTWFAGKPDETSFWSEWEALQPPCMDARDLAKSDPANYELRPLYAHPLPVQGEARQQAALQVLADSTQELGGYEAAKPDVEAVMRLVESHIEARNDWVYDSPAAQARVEATEANLRAALEGKHDE